MDDGGVMQELILRKIARDSLDPWNTIFSRSGDVSFHLAGESYRVVFLLQGAPYEPQVNVKVSCGDQRFHINLEIGDTFIEEQIRKSFDEDRILDLPPEIKALVCEVAFGELIASFESWSGARARIDEVQWGGATLGPREHEKEISFSIMRGEAGAAIARGHLGLGEESFRWVSHLLAGIPASVPCALDSVPMRCSIETGKTRLLLRDLKGLERFDLIMVDEYYPARENRLVLRFQTDIAWWAVIDDGKAVVRGRKEEIVPEGNDALSFDEMEIELRFEVGRKQIPLKDLGNLKPGYAFDLEAPIDRSVAIRANGKKIGCGELVQINDHIGVRIVEMVKNAADEHA